MNKRPNVVYVFGDQHRAEATGYAGNPDVHTPNLDRLKEESVIFSTAVSTIPVCSPHRASFLTGCYPLTHGVFVNDVHLNHEAVSIADAYQQAGYDTAYIGKWHVNGRGRSRFIPREDRQGFDYWQALECTHEYHHSSYYQNDPNRKIWAGYDAEAQTHSAQEYLRSRRHTDRPFFLVLSWGPPHNPYHDAPQSFQALYRDRALHLRPNVPEAMRDQARTDLQGYYAHITALDSYLGDLWETLQTENLEDETILVYTSDHGDMLYSQGEVRKQRPWDESILVPFLLHYPQRFDHNPREITVPFASPDIMPTLLGLSGIAIPSTVEGTNFAPYLFEEHDELPVKGALIECIHPFGEYTRAVGGREYRGLRTKRYTYVKDLRGPWLLYDNVQDPYQLHNLCNQPETKDLQARLEALLVQELRRRNDEFLPGEAYLKQWGYSVDETGTVPYTL